MKNKYNILVTALILCVSIGLLSFVLFGVNKDVEKLNITNEQLVLNIESIVKDNDNKSNIIILQEAEIFNLKNQLAEVNVNYNSLKTQFDKLKENNNQNLQEIVELEQQLEEKNNYIQNLETVNTNLQTQNEELSNSLAQEQTRYSNLLVQYNQLLGSNGDKSEIIKNLRQELETSNNTITELQSQLNTVNSEKAQVESELATEKENYNTLKSQYDALVEDNNLKAEDIARLENEISTLTSAITELQAEIDNLELSNENLQTLLDSANAQIVDLQQQLNNNQGTGDLFKGLVAGTITEVTAEDLEGVTEIRPYSFYECDNLTVFELSDTITNVGKYAFYGCGELTTFTLNNNITTINDFTFSTCSKLKDINNTSNVKYIKESAFESTAIEHFDFSSTVTVYKRAFYSCDFKTVNFTNNLKTIGSYAFSASRLEYLEIPSSVTNLKDGFAFSNNNLLKTVIINEGVKSLGNQTFHTCSNLEEIILANSITELPSATFWNAKKVTKFNVPTSLTTLENFNYFSLENLIIPENVNTIDFNNFGMATLKNLYLANPGFTNKSTVTEDKINTILETCVLENVCVPVGTADTLNADLKTLLELKGITVTEMSLEDFEETFLTSEVITEGGEA